MKPFRLMVGARDFVGRCELIERARLAESIGFSHICIHDHLLPQLAPILGLQNYQKVFSNPALGKAFNNTVFYALGTLPIIGLFLLFRKTFMAGTAVTGTGVR
jgi:ABC-type glycerol-3-phosphate transport system permease component